MPPEFSANEGTKDALPKGEATRLNEAIADIDFDAVLPPEEEQEEEEDFAEPAQTLGNITGFDDQVFGPSDRPNEPITAGAPFGPGASSVSSALPNEGPGSDQVLRDLVDSPSATPRTRALAARVLRGD